VGTQQLDFAQFYRESKDACLFAVLVSVGDRDVTSLANLERPAIGGLLEPLSGGAGVPAVAVAGVLDEGADGDERGGQVEVETEMAASRSVMRRSLP
jgi:hypothetical protein